MGMKALARVFQPLDTSHVDAALDRAGASAKAISVRARALRMDVSCGDEGETLLRVQGLLRNG